MNSQHSEEKRIRVGFLVAGVITLLLIGLAGVYMFLGKSPTSLMVRNSQPGAAIFVSQSSPAMVSLLVNPDALQSLVPKGEFSQLKTSLLAKSNIDYQDDIKAWLSNEITLAVTTTDIDRDPENGLQTGYLMALATNNSQESREFMKLLFSQRALAGASLGIERYKGVKVIDDYQEDLPAETIQNSLAGAVVNNFVLFANHPKVIKEAINNLQAPDLNLLSSLEYQKATQQIPKSSVAVAFLNLPEVGKWQGLELAESTYHSQILSLALDPQGLLAESTFLTTETVVPPSLPLSKPVGALKYIPESTALAIAGTNLSNLGNSDLAKLWEQGTATIYGASEDAVSRLIQPVVKIQENLGLNLSQDIFSWVLGEYAIALLPNSETVIPDWVFVVEKTPQLAAGIASLDQIASTSGFNVSSLNLNGSQVSAWTELTATAENDTSINVDAKVRGVHTTLDNYEIFTANLKTLTAVLNQKEKSLLENPQFHQGMAVIPQPNQGYIYLDWENSQDILKSQLPWLKFVEIFGKPVFDNLRSLTISSYSSEPGTLKGGVFWQFN